MDPSVSMERVGRGLARRGRTFLRWSISIDLHQTISKLPRVLLRVVLFIQRIFYYVQGACWERSDFLLIQAIVYFSGIEFFVRFEDKKLRFESSR